MVIKIFLKKLIPLIVAVVMAVTFTGCFDLGDFENEEDYYEAFGDVKLVYQDHESLIKDINTSDYSVEDYFYNANTGNDFTYGNPDDDIPDEGKDIPQLAYLYMAIPMDKSLNIDSFALFFNSTVTGGLKIEFYLVDDLPGGGGFDNVKIFGDPEYREVLDGDGKPLLDKDGKPILEPVLYDDPSADDMIAKANVYLDAGVWNSVLLEEFDGDDVVTVNESQYLLLKFVNNGGYKAEEDLVMPFRTTNLLVRAVA